jgi:predicted branched-subunit amino acid permease
MRKAFTLAAIRLGSRRVLPLLTGLAPFGIVVGLMGQGEGLSFTEMGLMSGLVYAGSAQLVALSHWAVPAPILAATFAAFVVNLRLVLMGPVLAPWLDRLRGWRLLGSLFLMSDQNWALSVEAMRRGEGDAGFLFGSGFLTWLTWLVTTLAGHALGQVIAPPPGHPLFFAALAVFIALLVPMWRGRSDGLAWVVAAGVSVLASMTIPGSWYIVLGALAGSGAGLARDHFRPQAPGGMQATR